MVLRTPQGEALRLKAPRALRRELERGAHMGRALEVSGREKGFRRDGSVRRKVREWRWIGMERGACAGCRIRVCTKANCWEQGGRDLWDLLERAVRERGLEEVVELKAVKCMGRCKRAPNLECRGRHFERCQAGDALALLERLAAEAGCRGSCAGGRAASGEGNALEGQ